MRTLVIDAAALARNLDRLRRAASARIIGVVKGNGYGLGLTDYARFLTEHGVDMLAVSTAEEAAALRQAGIAAEVLMLSSTAVPRDVAVLLDCGAILTVGSCAAAETVSAVAVEKGVTARVHVKLDTGMGRFGFLPQDVTDTAGIRNSADRIEAMGVERSRQAAQRAALALLVLDGSQTLTDEDEQAMAAAEQTPRLLVLVNKSDLPQKLDTAALAERFPRVLHISAQTGAGLDALAETVAALYPAGETPAGELLTNARQADAVERALSAVAEARGALDMGMTPDVVLTDCEAALEALGELNGKRIREDLVDTIFSRFCVGK